jgi:hypothetical protein
MRDIETDTWENMVYTVSDIQCSRSYHLGLFERPGKQAWIWFESCVLTVLHQSAEMLDMFPVEKSRLRKDEQIMNCGPGLG